MLKLVAAAALSLSSLWGLTPLRVACGSATSVTDSTGTVWNADSGFSGGISWSQTSFQTEPYRHLRYATSFTYNFTVLPGQYQVTLKFLEPNKTAIRQRTFSVFSQNILVISLLDLFAAAPGMNVPYDKTFFATVAADGKLALKFVGTLGNAVVSAIQIADAPLPAVTLLGLASCSGSIPPVYDQSGGLISPGRDCAGLWKATIVLPDNTTLVLVGPSMPQLAVAPPATWTEVPLGNTSTTEKP